MKVQLEDVVVLRLSVSTLGRFKSVKGDVVRELEGEAPTEPPAGETADASPDGNGKRADRKKFRVDKEWIPKEFYKEISRLDSEFESRFKRITQPGFFGSGDRLAHVGKAAMIHALVEKYREKRGALVVDFLGKWTNGDIESAAKAGIGPLYDPSDYLLTAEKVRDSFDISFLAMELGVHSKLPPELQQAMSANFEAKWKDAFVAGQKSLRADFFATVKTLLGELQPEEGKKGKIYDSVVEAAKKFEEEFEIRDMVGDKKLSELVQQVGAAMKDVASAEDLRNYKGTAKQVAEALAKVLPQAEELTRVFD